MDTRNIITTIRKRNTIISIITRNMERSTKMKGRNITSITVRMTTVFFPIRFQLQFPFLLDFNCNFFFVNFSTAKKGHKKHYHHDRGGGEKKKWHWDKKKKEEKHWHEHRKFYFATFLPPSPFSPFLSLSLYFSKRTISQYSKYLKCNISIFLHFRILSFSQMEKRRNIITRKSTIGTRIRDMRTRRNMMRTRRVMTTIGTNIITINMRKRSMKRKSMKIITRNTKRNITIDRYRFVHSLLLLVTLYLSTSCTSNFSFLELLFLTTRTWYNNQEHWPLTVTKLLVQSIRYLIWSSSII